MRGTCRTRTRMGHHPGIISALAGNMVLVRLIRFLRWDHPRACGEHLYARVQATQSLGPSPRLRGTYHRILPDTAPPGNHSSQICLATRAESDICTYRGSHCSPASRSVFPHRERACADSGNSSIDEYPARVIPTPYFPRLNIPPFSTVYQANQAIGVGIPHADRIQRLISAVPSS